MFFTSSLDFLVLCEVLVALRAADSYKLYRYNLLTEKQCEAYDQILAFYWKRAFNKNVYNVRIPVSGPYIIGCVKNNILQYRILVL